jgi:antitoxin VapB
MLQVNLESRVIDIHPGVYHDSYQRRVPVMQTETARVFRNGRSQAVRIPAAFRFQSDEVYIERDSLTGVVRLSEKPFKLSAEEIFRRLDEAGTADFEMERDMSPPVERDLF